MKIKTMFATIIKVECQKTRQQQKLYTVTVKEPHLIFFTKSSTYTNLSKSDVQKLPVPYGMFSLGLDVDLDCIPNREL